MGLIYSLLCAFCASSKDLVSKRLSLHLDGALSAFASFAFALPYYVLLLLILWLLGVEDFAFSLPFVWLVVMRSLTDVFAEWLKMSAMSCGDISFIAPFLAMSPVFLLVFSPLLTGDSISNQGIIGVFFIIAGNTLALVYRHRLTRGELASQAGNLRGVLLALGSSLFFCLNTCLDRLAVQNGSATLSGFTMTLLAAILLLPSVWRRKQRDMVVSQSRPLFMRGFFETCFMVSKLSALRFFPAPYVDGIAKLSIIFSIIGGRVFFKEPDFMRRMFFGIVVLVGVVFVIAAAI